MNGITKQTRRQSYDGIRTRSGERCKLILETLGNRSMTVEEITDELVAAGHLKYYDRNAAAAELVPGRDYDPDTGEVYETTGQSADDRQTTSGRNNIKVVKIAPVKEA